MIPAIARYAGSGWRVIATGKAVARQWERSFSTVACLDTSRSRARSCSALSNSTSRAWPAKCSSRIRSCTANPVADRVAAGEQLEPPLLIAGPDLGWLVILEGHNRLIGYMRAPKAVLFPIAAMVGVCPTATRWSQW